MKSLVESFSCVPGTNMSQEEIIDGLKYDIEDTLSSNEIDVEIKEIWLHGSRLRGDFRKDSDLDVVLFYKGNYKEDELFNIFHDEECFNIDVNGIPADVNPVKANFQSDIERYKKKSNDYDKNKK